MTMEGNQLIGGELVGHNLFMIKCVVVGDTGVGKTRLICSRACGTKYGLSQLMQTHVPTVWAIDQYRKNSQAQKNSWCVVDGATVSLRLWDTFGDHNKDRRFAYGRADVVLVCFSVVHPRSLRNVVNHWFPEIQNLCPGVPVILCGCQVDLRYLCKDPGFVKMDKGSFFREITEKDILLPDAGRAVAKQIGAAYYETSVLEQFGIDTVFANVARVALIYKRERHFWTNFGILKQISKPLCQQPHLPPKPVPPKAPVVEKQPCDRDCLLEKEAFFDVIFLVQNVPIKAHKVCLVAASSVFEKLFLVDEAHVMDTLPTISLATQRKEDSSDTLSFSSTELLLESSDAKSSCSSTMSSGISSCSSDLFLPVFRSTESRPFEVDGLSFSEMTIITVNERISPAVFLYILTYLYVGRCPQSSVELLPEVLLVSQSLGLTDLAEAVINIINNEDFLNREIITRFLKQKSERLKDQIISKGLFSDIVFELDDGSVKAHRALLVQRSDVMLSMFSCEFREKSAKMVPFPGVTSDIFRLLQEFLYTGFCQDLSSATCLELIELANRLCQSDLLLLAEQFLVAELTALDKGRQDIAEEVLSVLEPAQLHNATYLYNWCLWYIKVNYDVIYMRHSKLLHSVRPDNLIHLTNQRWPPLWYHREQDIYEKNVLDVQRQKPSHTCLPFGCLSSFSGRKNRQIKCQSAAAAV